MAAVLVLAAAGAATIHAQTRPTCVALGVGTWLPRTPGPIWRGTRVLVLTAKRERDMDAVGARRGWRAVTMQPLDRSGSGPTPLREYDRAWLWLAPGADSLVLLRPAILSEGMRVAGAWTGDTVLGRASAFFDAIRGAYPRANAYGVRFRCGDASAAEAARLAVERFRRTDVPNEGLGAREDSLQQAQRRQQATE
jgi:hypothetical protein